MAVLNGPPVPESSGTPAQSASLRDPKFESVTATNSMISLPVQESDSTPSKFSSEDTITERTSGPEENTDEPDLRKGRSVSFHETLHSSLAAAESHREETWKPDPPPPPLFDDFDNDDDWLI